MLCLLSSVLLTMAPTTSYTSYNDKINSNLEEQIRINEDNEEKIGLIEKIVKETKVWIYEKRPKYDPSYVLLKDKDGDAPDSTGVCTDLVIRAYRSIGLDLQEEVQNYLKSQGFSTDKNIDHRRCKNLIMYFENSNLFSRINEEDYKPGDIIFWILDSGKDHAGIVSDTKSKKDYLMLHHLHTYPSEDNVLRNWKIIKHYRLRQ